MRIHYFVIIFLSLYQFTERSNTLFSMWNTYESRLPQSYYQEKLLNTGDFLFSVKVNALHIAVLWKSHMFVYVCILFMFVETGLTNLISYSRESFFFKFFLWWHAWKVRVVKIFGSLLFSFFMEGITVCIILLTQYLSWNYVCVNFGFLWRVVSEKIWELMKALNFFLKHWTIWATSSVFQQFYTEKKKK